MKRIKLVSRITIGATVKSLKYKNIATVKSLSSIGWYYLSDAMYMNKDGTITGTNNTLLDTYRIIPYKRYIFKYKR